MDSSGVGGTPGRLRRSRRRWQPDSRHHHGTYNDNWLDNRIYSIYGIYHFNFHWLVQHDYRLNFFHNDGLHVVHNDRFHHIRYDRFHHNGYDDRFHYYGNDYRFDDRRYDRHSR